MFAMSLSSGPGEWNRMGDVSEPGDVSAGGSWVFTADDSDFDTMCLRSDDLASDGWSSTS